MAVRAQQINKGLALAGSAAVLIIALLVLLPVAALLARAETLGGISSYGWSVIRFTLFQAALSAIISVLLAIPVARALARRQFWGRSFVLTLMAAPFLLPSIVAVFGLLAIWGRSGVLSDFIGLFGVGPINIYGLSGILLAHVFFNFPLVVRMILQAWEGVPSEHFRLAAQLNMGQRAIFRLIEIPLLRGVVPSALLVVFLLCITSFAIVLALGGGPKATTIELAIYQALRFEFDLASAAMFATVQLVLCLAVAALAFSLSNTAQFGAGLSNTAYQLNGPNFAKWMDGALIVAALIFLATPMLMIVLRGVSGITVGLPNGILGAFFNSIKIASISGLGSILLALVLAHFIAALSKRRGVYVHMFAMLTLAASPFVIGTGLFIILNPFVDPFKLALPVTILVNTALTLPVGLRIILPALQRIQKNYGQTANGLGMKGWSRFRILTWPLLRGEIGFALGIAVALSMGDLGVIALFAPPDFETLPLLMYRLMGSYQMQSAAGVALILVASSFALFWICDKGGRFGHKA